MHDYETQHREELDFASSGRAYFKEIEKFREGLLANDAFSTLLMANPLPVLVIDRHRQIVVANPSALDATGNGEDAIGLRFGEFLGADHQMKEHRCGDPEGCANCNDLPAILQALGGSSVTEPGTLQIDGEGSKCGRYRVSAAPLACGDARFAILFLHPVD